MFIVSLVNFNKDIYPNWIANQFFDVCGDILFILDNKWTTDSKLAGLLTKMNYYVIPNELENQLLEKYGNEVSLENVKDHMEIPELTKYFSELVDDISEKSKIDAVYLFVTCASFVKVCREKNLYYKSFETSPIRKTTYSNLEFIWYMDNCISDSFGEVKNRFNHFINEIELLKIKKPLYPLTLLLWFSKNDRMLDIVRTYISKPDIKIGVALPAPRVEINRGWSSEKLMKYVDSKYDYASIAIREHPGYANFYDSRVIKTSDVLEFISRCETIITAGSSISTEALLFERNPIDLTNSLISSFDSNDYKVENLKYWAVNFIVFNIWILPELMFNKEYVNWRKTLPTESEIFNYNYDYIVDKLWGDNPIGDITDWNKVYNIKGSERYTDRSRIFGALSTFTNTKWETKNVYICGTGTDSKKMKELIENFGGKVNGFIVMDDTYHTPKYDGIDVLFWRKIEHDADSFYIISQRDYAVQKDVYCELVRAGMKNIIVV